MVKHTDSGCNLCVSSIRCYIHINPLRISLGFNRFEALYVYNGDIAQTSEVTNAKCVLNIKIFTQSAKII